MVCFGHTNINHNHMTMMMIMIDNLVHRCLLHTFEFIKYNVIPNINVLSFLLLSNICQFAHLDLNYAEDFVDLLLYSY